MRSVPISPTVIIQVLKTAWDKSARGAPSAVVRSHIPLGVPLPIWDLKPHENAILQTITWSSWNANFSKSVEHCRGDWVGENDFDVEAVRLKRGSDQLELLWTDFHIGAPARSYPNGGNTLVLHDNEWARVRWNGRFADHGTGNWWYESVTMNIGFFPSRRPESHLFASTLPHYVLDRLAKLH